MKTKIFILFFLLLGIFCYSQTLKSSISSNTIRYGEPVVLKIEVTGGENDKIQFPKLKDTLSYHLEILDNKLDTLKDTEKYTFSDSISFSAYEIGTFTVPPLQVIINSEIYETPGYNIKVDSMVIDSLKQPLYDIRPIIIDPKTFMDYVEQYWVYMVVALAIIIIIIILIILYYLEHKKKKSGKYEVANPDLIAFKKLKKLEKTKYLEQGQSKKYYSELVLILKEYIEGRWNFPATKFFSDDLIDYLEDNHYIKENDENKIRTIFHAADLAKFAKSSPSIDESRLHTEMAKNFITETKTEFLNYREEHEY